MGAVGKGVERWLGDVAERNSRAWASSWIARRPLPTTKRTVSIAAALGLVALLSTADAAVLTVDNFESYADAAALAAAWPDVASAPVQTLETAAPIEAAQSMRIAYNVSDSPFADAVEFTFNADQDYSLLTTLAIKFQVEAGSSVEAIVLELRDNADVVLGSASAPGGTGVSSLRWEINLVNGFVSPGQTLTQVRKVRLAIVDAGDQTGSGTVIFDELSLASGTYSTCRPCHGEFYNYDTNGDPIPYVSLADGQVWPKGLHDTHQEMMLDSDCSTCHSGVARFPVFVDSSFGGAGLPRISCMGCHGREQDIGHDAVSPGRGAGLRQHHVRAGKPECGTCHTDGNPDVYQPVGENVFPAYYFTPDSNHPGKPTNACTASELIVSTMFGLDNDGDLAYEQADPDCKPHSAPVLAWPAFGAVAALLTVAGVRRLRASSRR